MGAFAVSRLVALVVAAAMLPDVSFPGLPGHQSVLFWMRSWDGAWYAWIATHGYTHIAGSNPAHLNHPATLAWYPAYPLLIRWLSRIPGFGVERVGIALTTVAGAVAAAGLTVLGRQLTGRRRIGVLMAALWSVAPGSIVLSMMYTEALFCALAAWTLIALLKKRWLTAGVLTALAGTVRSTAVALVVAVVVAAVAAMLESRRRPRVGVGAGEDPITFVDRDPAWWRPVVACVIAPLGLLGFAGFVAWATGRLDGYFWVDKHYVDPPISFDWGRSAWRVLTTSLVKAVRPDDVLIDLVIVTAVLLLAWIVVERLPVFMLAYTAAVVVLAIGTSNYYEGKARFLLPAFLLALPVARCLVRVPNRVLIPLFVVAASISAWFGLYLMTVLGAAP